MSRHFRTCTLCEAMCGLVITTEGATVTDIRGDKEDPLSQGHICPKAVALQDIHTDPDRIRQPMKRVGDQWQIIGWDEALKLAVDGIQKVQKAHGNDAVAAYVGNPTVHSLGAMLFVPDLLRVLKTKNRYSATSVDQLPAHVAAILLFGHPMLIPVPDLDRSNFLLIFGANPLVSNGSLMSAPGVGKRLEELRKRGGQVVVIDPRRTETAARADRHHFVRPGSDAFVLLAMLQVIFSEKLEKPGRLAEITDGIEELRRIAAAFPPERIAEKTGMEPETIRQLARDFATASLPVAYGRVGVSMQEFGGITNWLVTVLNLVCGRLDTEGGAMFSRAAVDLLQDDPPSSKVRFGRWKSRVSGLPETAGELPVAALAEEIETPGEGQVRALLTHAGNPVLSTPNGARLDRALPGLEFFVAIDYYLNETTRHAHLILPPSSPLEREHYDLVFHTLAVRDTAKWSEPVFAKPAEARHEWEILNTLISGLQGTMGSRLKGAAFSTVGVASMVDIALRRGPYGSGWNLAGGGLSLARLRQAPHGLDFGPLKPSLPGRLRTGNGRIQAAPQPFLADIPRLEAALELATEPLLLIGRRTLRSNNSWMNNYERLVKGKDRCTLLIHPTTAKIQELRDGETVRLRSRVGAVEVPVEISETMMPGVVSLPHGWGHGRRHTRVQIANAHPGVSINDLTDEKRLDVLTGNAAFSGVPVTLERLIPAPEEA